MGRKKIERPIVRHWRHWTEQEVKYLEDNWGRVNLLYMAEKLQRKPAALVAKSVKLGIGPYFDGAGEIALSPFINCFGVIYSLATTSRLCKAALRAGLPVVVRKSSGKARRMVNLDNFWAWAENHKEIFPWYKLEPLMLGKEPEWVAEARHESYAKTRNCHKKWDWTEDVYLRKAVKAGVPIKDMAAKLGRSYESVRRRVYRIGLR